MRFVPRLDQGQWDDFQCGDFEQESTGKRYLDLSNLVPVGAVAVLLRCDVIPNENEARSINWGHGNDNPNDFDPITPVARSICHSPSKRNTQQFMLCLDSSRRVQYTNTFRASDSDGVSCSVQGWWMPSEVDRGDPHSFDWSVGDFITDDTWRDLDCSGIVPEGAKWILFRAQVRDSIPGITFELRKNGNTGVHNTGQARIQVANVSSDVNFRVSCDGNRVVEYRAANTTWSGINVVILGWGF